MVENNDYIAKPSEGESELKGSSMWRSAFLSLMTLALSGSLFFLAPIPLLFSFLLYGAYKSLVISSVFASAMIVVGKFGSDLDFLLVLGLHMALAIVFSFVAFSAIAKGNNPAKSFLKKSISLGLVMVAILAINDSFAQKSILVEYFNSFEASLLKPYEEMKTNSGVHEAIMQIKSEFEFLKSVRYSIIFLTVVFMLWFCIYVALRNKSVWANKVTYHYSRIDLINLRLPEACAYVVIGCLSLFLLADTLEYELLSEIMLNVIFALGGLFLLQGMGVYLAFLSYLRIFGLMRSFLTILTLLTAHRIIAVVGLLDLWFNFRKYFKKNEGDIS